jgi:2-polyprenyl-6-methoxyphenol hydroxylase-like FAD-dependent oxidoreductase
MDGVVAGGSPAGLMTAALLETAGARAEVCERGSEPTRHSRGTAMHPRTLRLDSHATHSVTVIPAVN